MSLVLVLAGSDSCVDGRSISKKTNAGLVDGNQSASRSRILQLAVFEMKSKEPRTVSKVMNTVFPHGLGVRSESLASCPPIITYLTR